MEKQYVVYTRYECWKSGPVKDFCNWFVLKNTPMTESEAKEYIKNIKVIYGEIDKKTKLKHEYKIVDYQEYLDERNKMMANNKVLNKKNEEYYKSDAYKELKKKKYKASKELKERQKKYIEEHKKEEAKN